MKNSNYTQLTITNGQNTWLRVLMYGILVMMGSVMFQNNVFATTYTLTTSGAANAQTPGNWNTNGIGGGGTAAANFTTSGDVFIIASGTAGTFLTNTSTTFATGVTLQINGTFTIGSTANNITTVIIDGTIVFSNASSSQVTLPSLVEMFLILMNFAWAQLEF